MQKWLTLFCIATTLVEGLKNISGLHGVYYVPSFIGLNPLSSYGQSDLYSDFMTPIHERDLDLLAKVGNYIRLTGSATRYLSEKFLDMCHERGLKVILTWSFMEYDLRKNSIRDQKRLISTDFKEFVEAHINHPAIGIWSFGDVFDPIFSQDDQNANLPETEDFESLVVGLIQELYNTLVQTYQVSLPVCCYMYANAKSTTALTDAKKAMTALGSVVPFDCWILGFTAEDLFPTNNKAFGVQDNTFWQGVNAGGVRQVIVQFATSAYSEGQFRRVTSVQDVYLAEALRLFLNPAEATKAGIPRLAGVIAQEWSDQWWRGDTSVGCDSGRAQPYFQSRCLRGFQGLTGQFDRLGSHCIRTRPAVITFARAINQSYAYISSDDFFNSTKVLEVPGYSPGNEKVPFNTLEPEVEYCVRVFPTLFNLNHSLLVGWVSVLGALCAIALALSLYWRNHNYQGKKVGQQSMQTVNSFLDWDELGTQIKPKAEAPRPPSSTPALLCTKEVQVQPFTRPEEKHEEKDDQAQDKASDTWWIGMQSRKPLPGTPAVSAENEEPVFNLFLDLYLREQIKRQQYNVDRMIDHECTVLQTLADHCLVTYLPDDAAIRRTGVSNVHARLLEGYTIWLAKQNMDEEEDVYDPDKDMRRKYAQLLCFRVMVSLAEHIAHCPERLAQVFYDVLHAPYSGPTKDPSKHIYVISLDELQKGLDGDDDEPSIMKGTINFDDINDCGILNEKSLKKTWYESPGPAVVFDYMRDYDVIAFFKMWIFCLSSIAALGAWNDPEEVLYPFCQIEAGVLVGSETIQFIYQWRFQNRALPWDRVPGFFSALLCGFYMHGLVPYILKEVFPVWIWCVAYAGFRIVQLLGLPIRYKAKLRKVCCWRDPYLTAMPGRLQKDASVSSGSDLSLSSLGDEKNGSRNSRISRTNSFATDTGADELNDNSLDVESTEFQALVFWIVSFGLTFVAEVYMIVPIASLLTYDGICWDSAMERCLPPGDLFGNNICGACYVAITIAKILMAVTVFSDTPLIFYLSVAAWGYIKGQKRKVANVFSMDACKVDLRVNGHERNNIEAVFGKWENSQEIWKAMINELYTRDLICESDLRKLCTSGKKWEFSQLNPEPRQRLSFWLQTVKAMAKRTKTDRRDHLASFFPPKTSKLKRTQLFLGTDAKLGEDAARARNHMYNSWISRRQQRTTNRNYKGPMYVPKGTTTPANMERAPLTLDSASGSSGDISGLEAEEEEKSGGFLCCKKSKNTNQREKTATRAAYDMTNDEAADRDIRSIPRLSHIITCYNETVMLSMDYLRDRNGDLTNLEHMIDLSTYRSEWGHAEERFRRAWELDPDYDMLRAFLQLPHLSDDKSAYDEMEEALVYEVRVWASMRAQTLIRTIRGALSYHDSLRQRFACYQREGGEPCDLGEGANLGNFVELIIGHQTYGDYPNKNASGYPAAAAVNRWKSNRDDVDFVMKQNKNYPIFLVYDYKAPPGLKDRDPTGKIDFDFYWKTQCEPYWEKDEADLKAYWVEHYGAGQNVPPFRHATMIKSMVGDELKIISVLPRMFPLRIGPGHALTQGKAANQINALRCVSGHVIQVSDANMDGWIGEGFKLPYITRTFQDGIPSARRVGSRTSVRYRIIGFREYIYTGPLGSVATAMASSEFTFGTLFQRVLSNPLNVRMHYGHPDFFDAFWVLNRGTLSKASPNLNLSEDVFSGYNTVLRNEKITHSDQLEWQKGREVVFTASSGFLGKITAGSVAIQRSRDMKYMQFRLDFPKKLSLYFGGIGSYVLNLMIDYSILLYTLFFTFSAYATITLADIQTAGSALGTEWLVGLGLVTSLGYLTEMMLEHGWGDGLLQVMRSLPATALFYLFQNKVMAHAIVESIRTGNASYFDSGRPNAFDHYTLRTMYHFYAESHYYPAVLLFSLFYFYNYFVGLAGGALPMFLVASASISWIVAPVVFCPQIGNINILKADTVELMHFIFSVKGKVDDKNKEESLDRYWREKDRSFHDMERKLTRMVWWLGLTIPTIIIWLISFSTFIDHALIFVWVWLTHVVCTVIFFYSNYTNLIRGIWYFIPLLGAILAFLFAPGPRILNPEVLIGAVLFMALLRVVHWGLLLLLATGVSCMMPRYKKKKVKSADGYAQLSDEEVKADEEKKKLVEKRKKELKEFYAKWVENFYFAFLDYHVHLYCGIVVGLAQVVVQLVFMLLSWVIRWILRFYNSQKIRSAADFNLSRDCVRVMA